MIAGISPSSLQGKIPVPPAKSSMQRACALALLNDGQTTIYNPGNSDDDLVAIKIIKTLGATVSFEDDRLRISSNGRPAAVDTLECGESGLAFRMFAAIAGLSNSTVLLNGSGSLLQRPMHFIDEIFPLLHIKTISNCGFLPVRITGPLIPADISVDGSQSSQYLTGLLFALAKAAHQPLCINVSELKSKPYIDLSLQMLAHFGYDVSHSFYRHFQVKPVVEKHRNIIYHTEGDWSSASFLLVAGAIAGNISLQGLELRSLQADKAILDVLQHCNAEMSIEQNNISVKKGKKLTPFEFDATDCPDLFPPLVALAAYCHGTSAIKGISRLTAKESNRAETLQDVFSKMGIQIILEEDIMLVRGGGVVKASTVSSFDDHRIAMACAVAALGAEGSIFIQDAQAVNKSYPDFYDHLKKLGASVSLSASA